MKEVAGRKIFDWSICSPQTKQSRTLYRRTTFIAVLWAAVFILGSLALRRGWLPGGFLSFLPGITCLIVGIFLIAAYVRFSRSMDELFQKIQMEGLAFGFGGGLIGVFAYRLLEHAGAPAMDINDSALFMILCWVAGTILAMRKYS